MMCCRDSSHYIISHVNDLTTIYLNSNEAKLPCVMALEEWIGFQLGPFLVHYCEIESKCTLRLSFETALDFKCAGVENKLSPKIKF